MQINQLSQLPPAPVEGEATDIFNAKASAFVAALSTLRSEMNQAIVAINNLFGGVIRKTASFAPEPNRWYSCPGGVEVDLNTLPPSLVEDDFIGLIPDASWVENGPIVKGLIEGSTEDMQINQTRAVRLVWRGGEWGWVRA